jgi:hypothetical protein
MSLGVETKKNSIGTGKLQDVFKGKPKLAEMAGVNTF